MNVMRLFVAVALTLAGQLVLAPKMAIAGVRPDFLVLLLVILALRTGPAGGALLGFTIGILQGLIVPETLGMDALAKAVVGWAVGKIAPTLAMEGPPLYFGLPAVSLLAHDVVFLVCLTRLDVLRIAEVFVLQSVPIAVYTGVLSVVVGLLSDVVMGGVLNRTTEARRGG